MLTFPLTWSTIILGFTFLFFSFTFPLAAEVTAVICQYIIDFFYYLIKLLNKVPYSHQRIPTPFIWLIILYYTVLLLFIIWHWKRRIGKIFLIACSILFLLLIISPFPPSFSPYLTISFLDVGRGDAILIEFPGRQKMLLDGGGYPDNISYIGENVVSPHLWHKRIKKLDIVAASHSHIDHIGGLLAIVDNFEIKEIWHGNPPSNNWLYEQLKIKAKNKKIEMVERFRGFSCNINGIDLKILNPMKKGSVSNEELNSDSLVIMLEYGNHKILLTADIEAEVERELIKQYGSQLRCLVLKASHHGSTASNIEEFLSVTQPNILVISGWLPLLSGDKNLEIVKRLHQKDCLILKTTEHGQISLISDGNSIRIKTFAQMP